MQQQKHNNQKHVQSEKEDLGFFEGMFDELLDESQPPCGAKGCQCTDAELQSSFKEFSQLMMMFELLNKTMETAKNRIDQKIASKKYNPCIETEDDFDFDGDENDEDVPF